MTSSFIIRVWGLCYLLASLFTSAVDSPPEDPSRIVVIVTSLGLFGAMGLFAPRRLASFLKSVKSMVVSLALVALGYSMGLAGCSGLGSLLFFWKGLLWCIEFFTDRKRSRLTRLPMFGFSLMVAVVGQIVLFEELFFDGVEHDDLFVAAIFYAAMFGTGWQLFVRNLDLLTGGPSADREFIAGELASRLEVGMTVPEAVRDFHEMLEDNFALNRVAVAFATAELVDQVDQGTYLSAAMRRGGIFPEYWPRLLDLAHATQALPDALRQLALLEARKRPMLGARSVLVAVIVLLFCVFNFTYILGSFYEIVKGGAEDELPLIIEFGMKLQEFCDSGYLFMVVMALFFGVSWFPDFRGKVLRWISGRLYPSSLATLSQRAQLTQSLAALTDLGLPATAALEIASQALESRRLRDQLRRAAHRGAGFSELADEFPQLFPAQARFLIAAGERAGMLPEALRAVATLQAEEFEDADRRTRVKLDVGVTVGVGIMTLVAAILCLSPYAHLLLTGFGEAFLP